MYETSEGSSTRQRSGGGTQPSTKPVPKVIDRVTTQFGWRHANGVAVIRFLVAIWLVCLASIFCAFGDWWGAFLYAAAALVGWLAYEMPRWKVTHDAEKAGVDLR